MTNEEFQKLVLEKLVELSEGQKDLKADLAVLNTKVDRLATEGQKDVEAMLNLMDKKLDGLHQDMTSVAGIHW